MISKETLLTILSYLSFDEYREICIKLFQYHDKLLGYTIDITEYGGPILSQLTGTTMTLGFGFKDFALDERTEIKNLHTTKDIIKIGSNFGEHISEYYDIPIIKKSNRGRKAGKKRKKRGGKYFGSSTTFYIPDIPGKDKYYDHRAFDKIYKVKVYRTGNGQIPGVINADYSDAYRILDILKKYLSEYVGRELEYDESRAVPHMRNVIANLMYVDELKLNINSIAIGPRLQIIKNYYSDNCPCDTNLESPCEHITSAVSLYMSSNAIVKFLQKSSPPPLKIFNVSYQTAKNSSIVTVKFELPVPTEKDKYLTVKIYKQKIMFVGGLFLPIINKLHQWLTRLIITNYNTIIDDKVFEEPESESSDTCDDDYMYNEDYTKSSNDFFTDNIIEDSCVGMRRLNTTNIIEDADYYIE